MGVVMLRTIPIVLLSFYYYEFEFTTGTKIRSVACTGALLSLTWCVTFRFSPTLSVRKAKCFIRCRSLRPFTCEAFGKGFVCARLLFHYHKLYYKNN